MQMNGYVHRSRFSTEKKNESLFRDIPWPEENALVLLEEEYKRDPDPHKINLLGKRYKSRRLQPWVFPVVRKAKALLFHDLSVDHEYPPVGGVTEFVHPAVQLLLGSSSDAIRQQRVAKIQTLASTGGMHTGAVLLAHYFKERPTIYVANTAGDNHRRVFTQVGFQVKEYPYDGTQVLDCHRLIRTMRYAPRHSVFVLYACGHPNGIDPTFAQWRSLAKVMQQKGHIPFFDCSYQGLVSGDVDKDAWAVRYFVDRGFELLAVQSFSTIFGLASERVGNLTVVSHTAEEARRVFSQLERIQRAEVLGPPVHGLRIVSLILNDPVLFGQWKAQLQQIHRRLVSIRKAVYSRFALLQTPGTWTIQYQKGMFWWTGLQDSQLAILRHRYHIYIPENGRVNLAGLSSLNMNYFVKAIHEVLYGDRHSYIDLLANP
ncbi:Aspartate aminotransferase, cytoplasmic [Apophysomyces ossiformis]|uniref:Aspartate aminotransferase, cytoplasmic n=1 Tax=Apophysomyces ossiformis TaxID=679940 RepID=A0A8H7BK47_9FUNG|nr:Aspartate aminotransferase, cytoplasmic [Apophysomyces ossiformis]